MHQRHLQSLRAIGAPATSLEGVDYTDVVVVLENVLAQLSLRTEPGTSALCDALQDLGAQHGHSACLPALSRVYVCLARWFWSLYVPDIPLDPLLSSQALRSLYERETANLVAEAAIEDEATRSPGGRGARRLEVVTYRLKILEQCLKVTHAGVRQGESSHESLMALFTELRACTTVLLGSDVLLAISEGTETVPRPQLENLQTSLVAIHTRLKTFYTAYSDLVKPITLALGSAALGLGISISVAKEAHRVQTASTITDITAKLITWPSLASSRHLPEIALPTSISADVPAPIPPASGPLLTLRAIAATRVDYTEHLGVRTLQQICAAYEKVFTLWTIDRKRAEQERLQSESIYRSRRQDVEIASEAAQEEADLRSLFPTFDGEGEGQAQIRSAPNAKTLLRYDDLRSIYETHTQLFSPRGSKDLLQVRMCDALSVAWLRLMVDNLL